MTDQTVDIERLERLAVQMDSLFRVPGTKIRVGLDPILGLVPGIGDALALAPSVYILQQGHKAGVPAHTKGRMVANIAIDTLIGSIPLIGDLFDIGYKSKIRNVALIREHLEKQASAMDRAPLPPQVPHSAPSR